MGIFGLHHASFFIPNLAWLPSTAAANAFLKTLWQVHATILALSAVVVTVIVTILASEQERAQTWQLYRSKTKIALILKFNVVLLASEGLSVLQTLNVDTPLLEFGSTQCLILVEAVMFVASLLMLGFLYTETFRFLDPVYVEDLSERRVIEAVRSATSDDIDRLLTRH